MIAVAPLLLQCVCVCVCPEVEQGLHWCCCWWSSGRCPEWSRESVCERERGGRGVGGARLLREASQRFTQTQTFSSLFTLLNETLRGASSRTPSQAGSPTKGPPISDAGDRPVSHVTHMVYCGHSQLWLVVDDVRLKALASNWVMMMSTQHGFIYDLWTIACGFKGIVQPRLMLFQVLLTSIIHRSVAKLPGWKELNQSSSHVVAMYSDVKENI